MITALIRTHKGREESFKKAEKSCINQDVNVITHFDELGPRNDFSYNLICNDFKEQVKVGWFFYLDSDDYVIPGAIEHISKHLTDPDTAVICQFIRNNKPKPANWMMDEEIISRGKIGLPCIFLHSSKKDIANFTDTEDADYRFIKEVSEKMKTKFVKIPVVCSPKRNRGL